MYRDAKKIYACLQYQYRPKLKLTGINVDLFHAVIKDREQEYTSTHPPFTYIHAYIHVASSPRSRKRATSCCIGKGIFLFVVIAVVALSFYFVAKSSSDLTCLQHIYAYRPKPFSYSPFSSSINLFHYTKVKGVIHADSDNYAYNVTMCVTSCPLKVVTSELQLLEGGCPNNRFYRHCYVRLQISDDASRTDSQYYSRYMLKNSKVTFKISTLKQSHMDLVQLCVTTNNVTCDRVFYNISMECLEVLSFNQANNYSQTFTTPEDSYYCALWLVNEANHSINYTTTLEVVSYQLPTSGCKNFNTSDFVLDLWSHRSKIATRYQDVCILTQNNAINQGSATLLINVIANWHQNLAIVLSMPFSILVILLIAPFFIFSCYKCVKIFRS
jgi:hypothetical protein